MRPANPGRRYEADCNIDGQHILLIGSAGNLARFRGKMNVVGRLALLQLIAIGDPFALLEGVKIFAAEPIDEKRLDEATPDALDEMQRALCKAVSGYWPGEGPADDGDGSKKKTETVIP